MVDIKTKYKEVANDTSIPLSSVLGKNIKVLISSSIAWAGCMGLNTCTCESKIEKCEYPTSWKT